MPYDLLINACTVFMLVVGGLALSFLVAVVVGSCIACRPDARDLDEWDWPHG